MGIAGISAILFISLVPIKVIITLFMYNILIDANELSLISSLDVVHIVKNGLYFYKTVSFDLDKLNRIL